MMCGIHFPGFEFKLRSKNAIIHDTWPTSITDTANHLTRRCYDSRNRLVREVVNVTTTANVCAGAHVVSSTPDVNLMTSISYQVEANVVGGNTVKTERRDVRLFQVKTETKMM